MSLVREAVLSCDVRAALGESEELLSLVSSGAWLYPDDSKAEGFEDLSTSE